MVGLIHSMWRFCEFRRTKLPTRSILTALNGNSITSYLVPAPPATKKEGLRSGRATLSSLAQARLISCLTTVGKTLLFVSSPTIQLETRVTFLIARSGSFDHRNGELFVPSRS